MLNKIKNPHIEIVGYAASILTSLLWMVLVWQDPFFEGMNKVDPTQSFLMLVLPACLFGIGLLQSRVIIMLAAFLWSVPFSIFMLFSSSMFVLFGVCCLLYLVCAVLSRINKIRYW
ncbi:hypothetical protein [Paenibacillus sp. BC26]|uniref:hypothetical protein n=1 Tax=Paenibacillus sp. BC26 TaxID=1881032 RepID=UPI0008E7EB03|nr:hypothetical protein [Paenibacillus sp. BC26]SFS74850.1 hypothetical protein SAMN05428962_2615 [Paenibacillus sp. BC26]